jgi:hypothetical protein
MADHMQCDMRKLGSQAMVDKFNSGFFYSVFTKYNRTGIDYGADFIDTAFFCDRDDRDRTAGYPGKCLLYFIPIIPDAHQPFI